MKLIFGQRALADLALPQRKASARWGAVCAARLRQRLVELAAAEHLGVVAMLPALRLVPEGDQRLGHFSVVVDSGHRLVLEAVRPDDVDDTLPLKLDEVRAVRLLTIEDTHGR